MSSEAPVLKLYNTLSRAKEEFRPLDPANVRMYVCGPTVYDYAHIGNARPIIVFDVLFRLLRHLYGADHVTYVRNITDVDDKINARAAERGITIRELTEGTNKIFQEDVKALGCLEPSVQPRATEHIAEMIALIEKMIAAGHAYAADGHVLFDVPSMAEYGRLSRRPLDEMIAGARVDVAPYKRGDMDFVLWKPSKESEPGWDSPWGRGRPGWHLECSAMSWKHLGEVFDIHGGGIDLVFPHHENEIAQTRCAFGHEAMANYWMHNGFLQVEGEKMSKSLGNFVTINELLHTENFGGRKWPGEVLRLAMLRTHYRQPIDFTVKALEEAEASLRKWSAQIGAVSAAPAAAGEVLNALADDLNTPLALASLHELDAAALDGALKLFGIDICAYRQWVEGETKQAVDAEQVSSLISSRLAARAAKNWAESDRIRDELAAMGVALKDNKDGTTTWEVKR
ncbi:cysteinyl-tRNA synthetase [Methylosinus sp. sav-2]|uniref:cysteine--tRNA ligase n=1 Tax=unclassified Methylosinus TaxID=2624500 RepID=UPI00046567B1|nr:MULTISPECIES: cysteine--tRNA ligase [unclassified Methylosinus]TDX64737.1 cysteinyl-tRNA synthetase [Methylosinus sp. sav-2]